MPVYVLYEGRLIEKRYRPANSGHAASDLPAPCRAGVSTSFESPIDGSTISLAPPARPRPPQLWQLRPPRHPRSIQGSTRWQAKIKTGSAPQP